MGHETFKPRTRVHESWNVHNSGDVYNAICRMAQTGGNQALVGKHIGLNFPKQMECLLYLEHGGRPLTFNIEPVVDRTQCIIDDLIAVQFKVFKYNKNDSRPWYKRLFS